VNRLEPGVDSGIHSVGRERKRIGGRFDSAANPQAAKLLARTMDSPRDKARKNPRGLSIREQRVAQLVDQQLVHGRDLTLR